MVRRRRIYKWELDSAYEPHKSWLPRLTPPQLFVSSFLLLILLGTLGLKLLPGLYTGEPLGWIDALFTATSAVCVTGLIVEDTATYFTIWGQAFLLLLIQLGGLGIITFTTVLIVALGRRPSLRQEALTASAREIAPHVDYRRLVVHVIVFTIAFEVIGAILFYVLWIPRFGWGEAAWHAVFQSISAFCNAGFSTFTTSATQFQEAPITLTVFIVLIVVGGLGFLTLEELAMWGREKRSKNVKRAFRLSLHSQLVLGTTALLLVVGWIAALLLEWDGTLGKLPTWAKVLNALFFSTTARTAGFNTIDYSQVTASTNYLTIILMFIGGSPGSTAGGLKTTTIALPGLLAWSRFRGMEITNLWGRTIPEETIQRAVGLVVAAFAIVTGSIFFLTVIESSGHGDFLMYMFEGVSAFNTVGLSMGATGDLSAISKLLLTLLMVLGRVGLPTAAAALTIAARKPPGEFRYAYEDVVVG